MRVSSPTEAHTSFLATALSFPLAMFGAALTLGLFGSVV